MAHPSPTAPDELLKLCESVLAEQRRLAAYMNFETDVTPRLADSINLDRVSKIARALKERLEAEAQLATRLPTRAEIEAKFGEWAMTGESTVMKARWMHEWLLSGAATPAPTAALTEEHRAKFSYLDSTHMKFPPQGAEE